MTRIETTDLARDALYTKVNQIADEKANVDLDNLSATGQAIIETADATISNYIKEVPQKIKIELSGNDITIKAGSELVFGGTVYTTITLSEDKTSTIISSLGDGLYFVTGNSVGTPVLTLVSKFGSGSSLPADNTDYNRFYLTTDSTFYYYSNNAWGNSGITYPVCIVKMESGVASIAKDSNGNDLIFNGMGFVGHHIFVLPDIMGYEPNGINSDGSMSSVKANSNSLRIIEASSGYGVDSLRRWVSIKSDHNITNWTAYVEVEHESDADFTVANVRYYIRDLNLIKFYNSGEISVVDGLPLVEYYYDGSVMTSFTPRQSVRTATVEMLNKVQYQVDTNTSNIATKQDTLVSGTNIKTINSTSVLGSGNFALADQSLSNLDSNGQMIIDSANGTISNCILEIPQNIKLTLENNVLTLKEGSVVTISGSTYTTVTVASDVSRTISTTNVKLLITTRMNLGSLSLNPINSVGSGSSLPSDGSTYTMFFNTTDKNIYIWDGTAWVLQSSKPSYPLCIVDVDSNGVASFAKDSNGNDMIFNGACFVGTAIVTYPNIKGLIPNGLTNGKYASKSMLSNALRITQLSAFTGDRILLCNSVGGVGVLYDLTLTLGGYDAKTNTIYRGSGTVISDQMELGVVSMSGGIVTDFTIRQPVRTATVEMLNKKQNDITSITGYDATKTQTLKNINGVLTWVDD